MAVDRSQIPAWVRPYTEMPWKEHGRGREGVDCWGVPYVVLREQFGLDVPSYVGGYKGAGRADVEDIARLVAGRKSEWFAVAEAPAKGAVALGGERTADILLVRQWGLPCHVGLVVAPGWMLHVEEGINSVTVEYDGPVWRSRIVGVYRHARLA